VAAVKEKRNGWLPAVMLIMMLGVFALTRWPGLLPEPWQNFSAAYALAFCAGLYFPARLKWVLPLGALAAMELGLNAHYGFPLINGFSIANLLAYAGLIWLGTRFRARDSWFKLVGGGLLGVLVFYVVTNTASWIFDPGYAKTFQGWIQALTTGLPGYPPTWTFLKNSLLSGGLFTGLFCAAMKLSPSPEEAEETEPAEEGAPEPVAEEA